jgi:hypothetical protein
MTSFSYWNSSINQGASRDAWDAETKSTAPENGTRDMNCFSSRARAPVVGSIRFRGDAGVRQRWSDQTLPTGETRISSARLK